MYTRRAGGGRCWVSIGDSSSRFLSRPLSAASGVPASADSSIRHWHRSGRLPRFQRACPSTALDERVASIRPQPPRNVKPEADRGFARAPSRLGTGADRAPEAPLRRQKCWMVLPDKHGRGGAAPATKRRRHLYPFILLHPVVLAETTPTTAKARTLPPNPWSSPYPALLWADVETLQGLGFLRTPWSSPYPAPYPRQEREKRRPRPPLRGPGPHRRHHGSGRVRSVPGRAAFGR